MAPGYKGSYWNAQNLTSASLKSVALPNKIRCERCNKWKAQPNFSNKRLNDLRFKISQGGRNDSTSVCSLCTGQQVQELKCHMCKTWKGLEAFAKAQRKNHDTAKCMECMQEQVEAEPIEVNQEAHMADLQDDESEEDDESDSDDAEDSSWTPFQTTSTGTGTGNLIGDLDDLSITDTSSSSTGFYVPMSNASNPGTRAPSIAASVAQSSTMTSTWGGGVSSGFDPKKYGHPASVASSTKTNPAASSAGGKWAKVKAYRPELAEKEEEDDGDVWGGECEESESSSGTDDEDDDDDYQPYKA